MGIFHMLKKQVEQEGGTIKEQFSIKHILGLEIHQTTRTSLNYLSLGGWNSTIVRKPNQIHWVHSYCSEHWEFYINSLKFWDTMLIESDFGLRARISIEEKGIIIQ